MGNLAGALAVFAALVKPRLILPTLRVRDARQLDWQAFKRKGVTGVVFDKDNCLTKPLRDELIADLEESWKSCISTFGREKVLLVSNSAGSSDDPNLIQAEAVSRSLGVPVLVHDSKKPSRQCALDVARYFSPRPAFPSHPPVPIVWSVPVPPQLPRPDVGLPPRLVVVGDRLTTDVVLASRIRARGPEVVSVLTDRVWEKERVGTRVMRWMEGRALALVERRYGKDPGGWEGCLVATSQERQTEEIAGTTSDPSQSSTPVVFVTTFLSTLMRPIVSRLKRWYDGSLGIGFKTPEGWSRWKRIG